MHLGLGRGCGPRGGPEARSTRAQRLPSSGKSAVCSRPEGEKQRDEMRSVQKSRQYNSI